MKLGELKALLLRLGGTDEDEVEIRLGELESGPFMHAAVGGIWRGSRGDLILTPNDDEEWFDESEAADENGDPEIVWAPVEDEPT